MTRELRQIAFTRYELVQAIMAFDRMSPEPIIPGKVIDCRLEENEPVQTTNRILRNNTPTEITMTLEPVFLKRALVRYCIENDIVIPRDSEKTVAVRKGGIALVIKIP